MSTSEDEELAALEVVHHACLAGDYDAAASILYNRVYHGPDAVISRMRGRNEVALAAILDFFPFQDIGLEPRVSIPAARRWILHEGAAVLHQLGRLRDAESLGLRALEAAESLGEDHAACLTMHNLAETYLAMGALSRCQSIANRALRISESSGEFEDELVACTLLGTVTDLRGELEAASRWFDRALSLARDHG